MVAAAFVPVCTGCLEETFPTSTVTADQIANEGVEGLSRAIMAYMTASTSETGGIGYPSMMIKRDVMTADLPILKADYDYYTSYGKCTNLGESKSQVNSIWSYYYYLVQKTNLLIGIADENNAEDAIHLGNASAYRALTYFDLARLYEFKKTGIDKLDGAAPYGLTVPIVTEETTEQEARNNPRAPFYKMYRFIASDLNRAERLLGETRQVETKAQASIGTVYGLKARFWLELGTRFERNPEDLTELLSHDADADLERYDKLDITSADDCFRLAAEYARKAIDLGLYSPLSESQWFDTQTGFNTPNNAWMWAIVLGADDEAVKDSYFSFVSYMSPEPTYGVASVTLRGTRLVDADLFRKISDNDWRKPTWTDPDDVKSGDSETIFNEKYANHTLLTYDEWKALGAYVGLKFHPGQGERDISTTGNLISIPLMRIEEMYFIEAEAIAHRNGVAAGKQLLEAFINDYRYHGTYSCEAADMDAFIEELFTQKRIEFWGEGILMWDYKRLALTVTKDYPGSNHLKNYRINSIPGYVAPWMNIYIPTGETERNFAVVKNPDPSGTIKDVSNY